MTATFEAVSLLKKIIFHVKEVKIKFVSIICMIEFVVLTQ